MNSKELMGCKIILSCLFFKIFCYGSHDVGICADVDTNIFF